MFADRIGSAEELGAALMKAFLDTACETSALHEKLLFCKTGVLLTPPGLTGTRQARRAAGPRRPPAGQRRFEHHKTPGVML